MSYELRPAVRHFAEAMEVRLRENDHKGGWGEEQCSVGSLERNIIGEYIEYLGAKSGETGNCPERELVDMSNFCMMVYHRLLDNQNCWQ